MSDTTNGEAAYRRAELLYDWNAAGDDRGSGHDTRIVDETLRDGMQDPTVSVPSIDAQLELVRRMDDVGVHHVNIGYPGAGRRAFESAAALATMVRDEKRAVQLCCAARTHASDIDPIIEVSQKVGVPVEVMAFLGASPIRRYVEGWEIDKLEKWTRNAVRRARAADLPCTFVTEDTTRTDPETLSRLWAAAIEEGAIGLCICDTVGHATPPGVRKLVAFARREADKAGRPVRLDWHGHDDRGFSLVNAVVAADAGADRVHGCLLGVGERVGNTPLDLLMVNLKLLGWFDRDLTQLGALVDFASEALEVPIPPRYPAFGHNAFRTATGVHAAAIAKAQQRGDDWLTDLVYSSVPATMLGRRNLIEIGPMSGDSNIRHWLTDRGYACSEDNVAAIRTVAKTSPRVLSDAQILAAIGDAPAAQSA